MLDRTVEERVTTLEEAMARAFESINRLSDEMREFRAEMQASREASRREMDDFKAEMQASREAADRRMEEFKAEMRADRAKLNKAWGDLARKMGTMAEDLVAPSIGRILAEVVACPDDRLDSVAVRVRRRASDNRARMQEFDVVAACGDYVLINETRSRLSPQDIADFRALIERARHFFPEYADRQFIGAIASLYVPEELVRYGARLGLVVLGFGEGIMDVLNEPGFQPATF